MDDLIAFLNARLDEDEAAARRAGGTWHEEPDPAGVVLVDGEPLIEGHVTGLTAHIARHDPARVLREVAAKRAIVRAYEMWRAHTDSEPKGVTSASGAAAGALLPVLRHLAAAYSDHPDYREEWKP